MKRTLSRMGLVDKEAQICVCVCAAATHRTRDVSDLVRTSLEAQANMTGVSGREDDVGNGVLQVFSVVGQASVYLFIFYLSTTNCPIFFHPDPM